jgi:hypothetical protein
VTGVIGALAEPDLQLRGLLLWLLFRGYGLTPTIAIASKTLDEYANCLKGKSCKCYEHNAVDFAFPLECRCSSGCSIGGQSAP